MAILLASLTAAYAEPLLIGGLEFSHDDLENVEKLSGLFGEVFYSHVLSANPEASATWAAMAQDVWHMAHMAKEVTAMALPVAMCLYNYFWWQGPQNSEPNLMAGRWASELMYVAVRHAGCNEPEMDMMQFYIQQCHLRWRYLLMLTAETALHLLRLRDLRLGSELMSRARLYLREMKELPNMELLQGFSTHEVSFNMDYFPSATLRHGPVWDPAHLPITSVLEENYLMIRGELEAILASGSFRSLDESTRNAETQFGPRGDDWLTAYLFRQGKPIPEVCAQAPRTCALLAGRPEIAQCSQVASGAGFLRMRPGGRLKPHFGNAPRLSVHLGLMVPDGEITMSVGYEQLRWEEGKVIVFDDTFIHQVVHNGLEPRYVMNLWMCHPCDSLDMPAYCAGPAGAMLRLGLQPLPK